MWKAPEIGSYLPHLAVGLGCVMISAAFIIVADGGGRPADEPRDVDVFDVTHDGVTFTCVATDDALWCMVVTVVGDSAAGRETHDRGGP